MRYDGAAVPVPARRPEVVVTPDDTFLQAIIESPEDDAPRLIYLIYGDWLEDHGERERAGAVRTGTDAARRRPTAG
jgi:uncharacterized protein (TIGR02996 family)